MAKPKSSPMLTAALDYANMGLPIIPLHAVLEDGSCTCGLARCPSPGKHPRTPNGLKDATVDPGVIERWWSPNRWPNASIGGVGGEFLCLDIDAKNDGPATLKRLIEANTALPETAVVETGEYDTIRGLHYWYRVPEDAPPPATRTSVRPGIDIRCTGGYAVLPPSPHHSGVDYEWIGGVPLDQAAECPEWVLDLVPEYVDGESTWQPDPTFRMSKQVKQFLNGELEVPMGEQRDFLVAASRSVLTTGRSVELTASLLWEGYDGTGGISNCEWGDVPWTPEDIYAIVSDIYAKPPTTPLEKDFAEDSFTLDDTGNGERLLASFKEEEAQYASGSGKWLIWDPERGRFLEEHANYMRLRHMQIAGELAQAAVNVRSESEAKALFSWSKTSRMMPRIDAAEKAASSLASVGEVMLNREPYQLGVENGVLDLRDGELLENEPSLLITKLAPVEFNPSAKSRIWERFLKDVVPDKAAREFLQLAVGYTLTGSTAEHKFFYLYGRPGTGKTTFLDTIYHLLGSYASTADTALFRMAPTGNVANEGLARLTGARMAITHEVEENERFASALISQYTGGDPVTARFLYGKTFTFRPEFKLWIAANHRARVSGVRSGIWRRMIVVPMDEVVPPEKLDPRLPEKLREPEAMSAILNWALEGAVQWWDMFASSAILTPPTVIQQEGEFYKQESDHLFAFADEIVTHTGDPADRVPKPDLFAAYQSWCDSEGRARRVTAHQLSRRLTDLGMEYKNARYDGRLQPCWVGITIKGSGIHVPK